MNTLEEKLRKHPHARASTLVHIARRNETTERLRQEIEAAKRVNEFRDRIGYRSPTLQMLFGWLWRRG